MQAHHHSTALFLGALSDVLCLRSLLPFAALLHHNASDMRLPFAAAAAIAAYLSIYLLSGSSNSSSMWGTGSQVPAVPPMGLASPDKLAALLRLFKYRLGGSAPPLCEAIEGGGCRCVPHAGPGGGAGGGRGQTPASVQACAPHHQPRSPRVLPQPTTLQVWPAGWSGGPRVCTACVWRRQRSQPRGAAGRPGRSSRGHCDRGTRQPPARAVAPRCASA